MNPSDEEYLQASLIIREDIPGTCIEITPFKTFWLRYSDRVEKMGDLALIIQNAVAAEIIKSCPGRFIPSTGHSTEEMFLLMDKIVTHRSNKCNTKNLILRNGMIL